jgi:hypothetical protein
MVPDSGIDWDGNRTGLRYPGWNAIDARTARHAGHAISQQNRWRVEHSLGRIKMAGLRG